MLNARPVAKLAGVLLSSVNPLRNAVCGRKSHSVILRNRLLSDKFKIGIATQRHMMS